MLIVRTNGGARFPRHDIPHKEIPPLDRVVPPANTSGRPRTPYCSRVRAVHGRVRRPNAKGAGLEEPCIVIGTVGAVPAGFSLGQTWSVPLRAADSTPCAYQQAVGRRLRVVRRALSALLHGLSPGL